MALLDSIDYSLKSRNLDLILAKPDFSIVGVLNEAYNKVLNLKLNAINELKLNIPIFLDTDHSLQSNINANLIKENMLIKATVGSDYRWFIITKITKVMDQDKDVYEIEAFSLGYELMRKRVHKYKVDSVTCNQALSDTLSGTNWTVGTIESSISAKVRTFDIIGRTGLDTIFEIAQSFDVLVVLDEVNRTVSMIAAENIGTDKGLRFTYGQLMKSVEYEVNMDDMCTRLKVYGKNDISIQAQSPIGQSYIEDYSRFLSPFSRDVNKNVLTHSDYMSDSLANALMDYNALVASNQSIFSTYLTNLSSYQSTLTTQQNDLFNLNVTKKQVLDTLSIQQDAKTVTSYNYTYNGSTTTNTTTITSTNDYAVMCYVSSITNVTVQLDGVTKTLSATTWTVLGKISNATSTSVVLSGTATGVTVKIVVVNITSSEYTTTGNESAIITKYGLDYANIQINNKQANIDTTNANISSVNIPITVNTAATASGNITFTFADNGVTPPTTDTVTVAVTNGDSTATIANNINNAFNAKYPTYKSTVSSNVVTITDYSSSANANVTITFVANSTGVTTTITKSETGVNNQIATLRNSLSYSSNFTSAQLTELQSYVIEKELVESAYADDKSLYDFATTKILEINVPQLVVKVDIVNFLQSVEEQLNWDKLVLGDHCTIEYDPMNININAKISEIEYDFETGEIQLIISNAKVARNTKHKFIKYIYNTANNVIELNNKRFNWDLIGTNFDSRNDRKSTPPSDPIVASDGSALTSSFNDDGSADIHFNWNYTTFNAATPNGDQYDIDGFIVYVRSLSINENYTFGSNIASEKVYTLEAGKRSIIITGIAPNKYYTFGVQAYRTVDPDINSNGILTSNVIKSIAPNQDPYQPATSVNLNGNLIGANAQVNGTSAGTVVTNAGNGNTAYNGTTTYRDTTSPNGIFTCNNLSSVTNTDGSIDITLTWSFVQGTVRADGYVVVYENGQNVVPVVGSHSYFQDSTTTKMVLPGVSANTYHNFKIYAYRTTNAGLVTGTLTNAANWLNYQASTTPNYTGNVGGSSASTIAYNSTNNNINLLQNGGAEIYTGRSGTNIPDSWSTWQPSTLCTFTRRVNDASWTISGNTTFEINYVGTATTNTNGAYLQDYTKVNAGETYTFSCLLEAHRCGGYIRFEYYDVNGAMLGSDNSTSISNITIPTSMILTKTLPTNCVKLRCLLWKDIQLVGQTSSYLFADNVKLEKGSQATPYVEVDLGSSGTINNGIQQAINYNNVQINNIDGLKVSHTDGTNTIVNGNGVVVNGGNITIYDNNGRIVMDGRGLNPLENTGWGVTTGLTFSIASFAKDAYIEAVYTGATQSITTGTTLQLNSVTGLGTTTGTIYVAGTGGFNFNYDTVNATNNTIRVSAIGSGWGTSDNLYNNSILWVSVINGVSQLSPSGTLSLTVKAGSAVLKSGKYVNIATDQTMSVPISVGLTDFDGWQYRVVYLDSNGNLQYMNSGTSGGVYNQWAIDTYPDNPRVSTDANAVILGCILCGASSNTSGSGFNGYVILHPDFRDERAVKVYDKTVSGGEYKTNGVKSVLSTSTVSYGSNEYSAISLNATQTYKISIDIGQGKRFAIVALSSASGNIDTYAAIPNSSYTVYQDESPNYGAFLFVGLRNPYIGTNQPRSAIGYNNYFVEDRYTDANGQYIVHESSMGWTNRRVQDAWLEIGTDGETYLNIVLYQYSITESRNIRVNWTVM